MANLHPHKDVFACRTHATFEACVCQCQRARHSTRALEAAIACECSRVPAWPPPLSCRPATARLRKARRPQRAHLSSRRKVRRWVERREADSECVCARERCVCVCISLSLSVRACVRACVRVCVRERDVQRHRSRGEGKWGPQQQLTQPKVGRPRVLRTCQSSLPDYTSILRVVGCGCRAWQSTCVRVRACACMRACVRARMCGGDCRSRRVALTCGELLDQLAVLV
eukprot:1799810-Pleurochrysis_carterae.AAC.11